MKVGPFIFQLEACGSNIMVEIVGQYQDRKQTAFGKKWPNVDKSQGGWTDPCYNLVWYMKLFKTVLSNVLW